MPPPSSENDLKRRARRRLIGAVALTLLAVIVLPLLLEDEPPPASSLSVHMTASPDSSRDEPGQPGPVDAPEVRVEPAPPVVSSPPPAEPKPAPVPKAEPVKPAEVEPKSPEPVKAAPKPRVSTPVAAPAQRPSSAVSGEAFVVQLAALADSGKAKALQARAGEAGLPAYTDKVGALTRVRVGPYTTREDAVAAAVKLAESGMAGQVLMK